MNNLDNKKLRNTFLIHQEIQRNYELKNSTLEIMIAIQAAAEEMRQIVEITSTAAVTYQKDLQENYTRVLEASMQMYDFINTNLKFHKINSIPDENRKLKTPWFTYHNWYLSNRIWDDWEIKTIIEVSDIEAGEQLIIKSFYEQMDTIKKLIIEFFPERVLIIEEMFNCFISKQYHAVISIAYSQIDGMCYEKTKNSFWGYDSKNKIPYINALISKEDKLDLLNPQLRQRIKANDRIELKEDHSESNNRHAILHGHAYNYGNEKNAIRAILYIDYFIAHLESQINTNPYSNYKL